MEQNYLNLKIKFGTKANFLFAKVCGKGDKKLIFHTNDYISVDKEIPGANITKFQHKLVNTCKNGYLYRQKSHIQETPTLLTKRRRGSVFRAPRVQYRVTPRS